MPFYVLKVTQPHGWLRLPVIANFPTEDEAIAAVKLMVDDEDVVEVKGIRDDVMKAAFGDIPQGAAVFRSDWCWKGENDNSAEPY